MGDFTDATKNILIDWVTGKTTPAAVGTRYVSLYNGDPQGAGTEVTATIRPAGRVALTAAMAAASGGSAANSSAIDYGLADGGATFTHFGIHDNATPGAGTLLGSDVIASGSQTVTAGNPVSFGIGTLTIALTG